MTKHIGDGPLDRLFPARDRRPPPSASPEEVERVRRAYRGPASDEEAARAGFPSERFPERPGESSDDYRARMAHELGPRSMNRDAASVFGPAGGEGIRQAAAGAGPVLVILGLAWLWKKSRRR